MRKLSDHLHPKKHSKILINSVLGAVSDESSVFDFIEKAANLLSPGGRLLVSDIANSDKKSRFVETKFGKEFLAHWLKEGGQAKGVRINLDKVPGAENSSDAHLFCCLEEH